MTSALKFGAGLRERGAEPRPVVEGCPASSEELPGQFRAAMRRLAASVGVVVAMGADGPLGIAATSVTSLTVDPPAVLICVNRTASLHAYLDPATPLSVNLLARSQQEVSAAFGGGLPHDRRFNVGNWQQGANGLPSLVEAQANLSCVIDAMLAYGTHSIIVARVLDVTLSDGIDPLIYQDGKYL